MKRELRLGLASVLIVAACSTAADPIVVDNGTAGADLSAGFLAATGATDHYQTVSTYAVVGGDVDTARFTPDLPEAGDYIVEAWNSCFSPRSAAVPHTIAYAGGLTDQVLVDQRPSESCGEWFELGVYSFDAGTAGYVEITDQGVGDAPYIGADAVRFTSVASTVPQVCPDGMTRAAAWCIEETAQPLMTWVQAMSSCFDKGMRLAPIMAISVCDRQDVPGDCGAMTDTNQWIWTSEIGADVNQLRYDDVGGTARSYNGVTTLAGNRTDFDPRWATYASFCVLPVNTGALIE